MDSQPAAKPIARSDWDAVVVGFVSFFGTLGDVTTSAERAVFHAGFTGLDIDRDGSSRSFMPLHDLRAAWDQVAFDSASHEVTLIGAGATYTYKVPPQLLDQA